MMVTQEQLKEGLARYIDTEFVSKVQGLRKWGIALATSPLILSLGERIEESKAMLVSAGYLADDGMVDIDRLYADAMEVARRTGSVTEHLPIVGDVTFTSTDIESLRRCITG